MGIGLLKSLERESEICQIAIVDLSERVREFEKRYGMSSEDFYQQFATGELGDDLDYFEWKALIEGLQEWEKTDQELKELIDAKGSTG